MPFAIGSAAGVVGVALGAEPVLSAAKAVAQVVAGLAINYGSERITPLLGAFHEEPDIADDLDRVARHALLTILYETLLENGRSESEARKAVREADNAWKLRIFRGADPTRDELVELMRTPRALTSEQAKELARAMLPVANAALREPYAAAITARFAGMFELLLRGDERAFRAVTVYLQRLALADLQGVRGDLAQVIQVLTRPQPSLERYESLRKKRDDTVLITDLQFKRRATEYLPRQRVETALREWLLAPDRFRIAKVTGPAGMGKSRLAIELCDWCHREHWLAGFVSGGNWPPNWKPNRDTLAVVDYAASKQIAGQRGFQWLESLFQQTSTADGDRPRRVRIMLLDRTDQGPLWTDWRNSEIGRDLDACMLPVALDPDRAEFDAIVAKELRRRLGREPSQAEHEAAGAVAERLRGQFRPLFAALTAAALAEGASKSNARWSPELLVESILKSQVQQWSVAGITDEHLDLLFEATLTQGECAADPKVAARIESLTPATFAELAKLSEPGERLGPIVPDLLGEFFVLMRLRGEASTSTRQASVNIAVAKEILGRAWGSDAAEAYAGLVLEDFLGWQPREGQNPAVEIMREALGAMETGRRSGGLLHSCFAAAWKRPMDRDWADWLSGLPDEAKPGVAVMLAMGLHNATVVEPEPAQCQALANHIEKLHDEHDHERTVRVLLARALHNATVGVREPAQRRALADRIEKLHSGHGHEPAVREQLAMALCNATVGEPDPAQRRDLADRIEKLHDGHGQEPAVRELLAIAVYNATDVERDPARCRALADRIETLHNDYGHEPAVREWLVKALFNATVVEPDPARRCELAGRIETLHSGHGHEPAVRELLAKALFNATVGEPDPAQRRTLADRIETLHFEHGHEPAVREALARALCNATVGEHDPAQSRALASRIEKLHNDYGHEPAVREQLAKALFNATVGEPNPAQRSRTAEKLAQLTAQYLGEPVFKEILNLRKEE